MNTETETDIRYQVQVQKEPGEWTAYDTHSYADTATGERSGLIKEGEKPENVRVVEVTAKTETETTIVDGPGSDTDREEQVKAAEKRAEEIQEIHAERKKTEHKEIIRGMAEAIYQESWENTKDKTDYAENKRQQDILIKGVEKPENHNRPETSQEIKEILKEMTEADRDNDINSDISEMMLRAVEQAAEQTGKDPEKIARDFFDEGWADLYVDEFAGQKAAKEKAKQKAAWDAREKTERQAEQTEFERQQNQYSKGDDGMLDYSEQAGLLARDINALAKETGQVTDPIELAREWITPANGAQDLIITLIKDWAE